MRSRLRRSRIAFVSSRFGTIRHTCEHAREQLRLTGISSDLFQIEAIDARQLAGYDFVILNRVPASDALADAIAAGRAAGGTFVFDVDDLIFDESVLDRLAFVQARAEAERMVLYDAVRRMGRTMALCSHVLCYTSRLEAEVASRGYKCARINICTSEEMVACSERARAAAVKSRDFVTVGYAAGHPGHSFNFRVVETVLLQLLRSHAALRLALIGPLKIASAFDEFGDRVLRLPPVDWRLLPELIAKLDIAIAPLEDHPFNQCKSHLKYLEAGLCGVPLVASRVGQLAETIRDGQTGFLASSAPEWQRRLDELIGNVRLRSTIGEAARRDVLRRWTTRAQASHFRRTLDRILRETNPGSLARWRTRVTS